MLRHGWKRRRRGNNRNIMRRWAGIDSCLEKETRRERERELSGDWFLLHTKAKPTRHWRLRCIHQTRELLPSSSSSLFLRRLKECNSVEEGRRDEITSGIKSNPLISSTFYYILLLYERERVKVSQKLSRYGSCKLDLPCRIKPIEIFCRISIFLIMQNTICIELLSNTA